MYLALESFFGSLQLCKPGLCSQNTSDRLAFTSLAYTHIYSSSSFSTKVMMDTNPIKIWAYMDKRNKEKEKNKDMKEKGRLQFCVVHHHCIKQTIPGFSPLPQGTPTDFLLTLKWCIGVLSIYVDHTSGTHVVCFDLQLVDQLQYNKSAFIKDLNINHKWYAKWQNKGKIISDRARSALYLLSLSQMSMDLLHCKISHVPDSEFHIPQITKMLQNFLEKI